MPKVETLTCIECGSLWERERKGGTRPKYCSPKCKQRHRHPKKWKKLTCAVCEYCGDPVPSHRKNSRATNGWKFCSHKCTLASRRNIGQDLRGRKIESVPVGKIDISHCKSCGEHYSGEGPLCPYCEALIRRRSEQTVRRYRGLHTGREFSKPVLINGETRLARTKKVPDGHCVYRSYDTDGRLLYVGISNSFNQRSYAHHKYSEWYGQAVLFYVEFYRTRKECLAVESKAIRSENAIYNIAQNRSWRRSA